MTLRAIALFSSMLGVLGDATCDTADCIMLGIDDAYSVVNEAQCADMSPMLALVASGGPISGFTFYCGAYLEETDGVVVTDVTGSMGIFSMSVVDSCASELEELNVADVEFAANAYRDSFKKCITMCPYASAAPLAPDSPEGGKPSRYTVGHRHPYNGYAGSLPNNFGGLRGALDELAVGVPLALKYPLCRSNIHGIDFTSEDIPTTCCITKTMLPAAPSTMAAYMLFPSVYGESGSNLKSRISDNRVWYARTADKLNLYLFSERPTTNGLYSAGEYAEVVALFDFIEKEKASDFATLGGVFATEVGSKFVYGGISQYGTDKNLAKINFKVLPFQEALAYAFFSKELEDDLFRPGKQHAPDLMENLYDFFAFALNMLVRRQASVEALCGVTFNNGKKTACDAPLAVYPARKVTSGGCGPAKRFAFGELAAMKEAFDGADFDLAGKFKTSDCELGYAPPRGKIEAAVDPLVIQPVKTAAIKPYMSLGMDWDVGDVDPITLCGYSSLDYAADFVACMDTVFVSTAGDTNEEVANQCAESNAYLQEHCKEIGFKTRQGDSDVCSCLAIDPRTGKNGFNEIGQTMRSELEMAHFYLMVEQAEACEFAQACFHETEDTCHEMLHPWAPQCADMNLCYPTCKAFVLYKCTEEGSCKPEIEKCPITEKVVQYPETDDCNDHFPGMEDMVHHDDIYDRRLQAQPRRLSQEKPQPQQRVDDLARAELRPIAPSQLSPDVESTKTHAVKQKVRRRLSATDPFHVMRYKECVDEKKEAYDCKTLLKSMGYRKAKVDKKVLDFYECDESMTAILEHAICALYDVVLPTIIPPECPSDVAKKEIIMMWGAAGETTTLTKSYGGAKTQLFEDKGLPAANRLDALMNGAVELLAR